jgi:hypothetical protein
LLRVGNSISVRKPRGAGVSNLSSVQLCQNFSLYIQTHFQARCLLQTNNIITSPFQPHHQQTDTTAPKKNTITSRPAARPAAASPVGRTIRLMKAKVINAAEEAVAASNTTTTTPSLAGPVAQDTIIGQGSTAAFASAGTDLAPPITTTTTTTTKASGKGKAKTSAAIKVEKPKKTPGKARKLMARDSVPEQLHKRAAKSSSKVAKAAPHERTSKTTSSRVTKSSTTEPSTITSALSAATDLAVSRSASGHIRLLSNGSFPKPQREIDAELSAWLSKESKKPFHWGTQLPGASAPIMRADLAHMGFSAAETTAIMAKHEPVLVDGCTQRPHYSTTGKTVAGTGPLPPSRKLSGRRKPKHKPLAVWAGRPWLLFDPALRAPGVLPLALSRFEGFRPGNQRVLLRHSTNSNVVLQDTHVELTVAEVECTEAGPRIEGWVPIGTGDEPAPAPPSSLSRGARCGVTDAPALVAPAPSVPTVPAAASPSPLPAPAPGKKRRAGRPKKSAAVVVGPGSE